MGRVQFWMCRFFKLIFTFMWHVVDAKPNYPHPHCVLTLVPQPEAEITSSLNYLSFAINNCSVNMYCTYEDRTLCSPFFFVNIKLYRKPFICILKRVFLIIDDISQFCLYLHIICILMMHMYFLNDLDKVDL